MLKDDDLLPDKDLYKFPTIGQISKMSPIGTTAVESTKNRRQKMQQRKSQDLTNAVKHINEMSQSSFKHEDIIMEEQANSSTSQERNKKSESSAHLAINPGKFESQRSKEDEIVQIRSPAENLSPEASLKHPSILMKTNLP